MERFESRQEAGRILAEKLLIYKDKDPLVLAIPRGGVPVAFEVAQTLHCPLDILMVKKIGAPRQPELAVGAVSEDAKPIFNEDLVKALSLKRTYLEQTASKKIAEIQEQLKKFRGAHKVESLKNKTLLVIDDGIATGSTLTAALQFLRKKKPRHIVVATPVAAAESLKKIQALADDVVCLSVPDEFVAVGLWYEDFTQTSDEEVVRLLGETRYNISQPSQELGVSDGTAEFKVLFSPRPHSKGLIVIASLERSAQSLNEFFFSELNKIGFSTLLVPAPTFGKNQTPTKAAKLMAQRMTVATQEALHHLKGKSPIGYFGFGDGAGAAVIAATDPALSISAIVSLAGRPDLADDLLRKVRSPILMIAGEKDAPVIEVNRLAAKRLPFSQAVLIPHTFHDFTEESAKEEALEYTTEWFNKNLNPEKPEESPQEEVVQELESRAHPIHDAHSWDDLIESLASSRVVMLGETTHGTQEFYSIRRTLSERLIRDHGFSFIAVEGEWPQCEKLNAYIHFDKGSNAAQIMREFHRWPTWMWANDETALLIEWMKNYGASFYGLDIYSLFESMDYVEEFARKISPELAEEVQRQYACFDPFERDEKAYARYLVKFPEGCRHEVVSNLRKILHLRMDEISRRHPDLFSAQQNARIVTHAEQYYRAMLFGGPESWNVRDQHMIDTLDILLKRAGPQSKCIVWAHNSHIGDYHATEMLEQGYTNLGGLARERFGFDQVSLVGFGTYEGKVLAGAAWEAPESIMDLPPAREASFEYYCHKVAQEISSKRFYVVFDSDSRSGNLGTRSYGHRAVGVVYQKRFEAKGHNYVETIPAKRYDAFVFVDRTTPLISLHNPPDKTEFPETWPGGF